MKYEQGSFITVPSRNTLRGLHPTAQTIYMWLCSYANETGECFPSRSTLAKDARCSDRTVDEMLEILIEQGLLRKKGRADGDKQLSNLYTVMICERGAGGSPPPSRRFAPPAKEVRTNSTHLTQPIEGGGLEIREVQVATFGGEDVEDMPKPERVIPFPYSVEKTREAWSAGEVRLQVLNWYLEKKGLWIKCSTLSRLKAIMARHNSSAVRIAKAGWSPLELNAAYHNCMQNEKMETEWTLETIEKYLTK